MLRRVLVVALLICMPACAATPVHVPVCTGVSCSPEDRVWTETEVTRTATPLGGNPMPRASQRMLEIWKPQHATVRFVVDTTGTVERRTVEILSASDRDWAQALSETIPNWKFEPAEREGRKVRQLVQEPVDWMPSS